MYQLRLEHISKSYWDYDEEISVLKDVNLTVNKGDFVAICGQSGCGKSTLLHLIGFLDKADEGKIFLNDELITYDIEKATAIRKRKIGFIFQFHYLLDDLTAIENIALPLMVSDLKRKESLDRANELLINLGLSHRQNHYPHQLSGGEQQRVALGRALITNPEIVLADEPTGNLDPDHSAEILNLFIRLNVQTQCTFILVTHDRHLAENSKAVYRLDDGILIKS